jgi:putative FmdB family regulatory protein
MPLYDYECDPCKVIFEVALHLSELDDPVICNCGKEAHRVLLRAPGFNGKNKGLYPRFDVQLGCMLDSSQHMEQIAKSRGLVPMGVEEFDRSRHAAKSPHPFDSDEPDPQLIEIAKKAWDDVKYGRIAPEVEEDRVAEVIKQSDFLDVTKAPKVE